MNGPDLPLDLDRILPRARKPVRYIGGGWNAIVRQPQAVKVRMALAFPGIYESGFSHPGFRINYSLLNSRGDLCGERVFRPWPDMEGGLRRAGLPLMSIETFTPLTLRRDRILPAVRDGLHQHPDDARSEPPAAAQRGSRRGRSADHRRRARRAERRADRAVLRPTAPGSGAVSRQATHSDGSRSWSIPAEGGRSARRNRSRPGLGRDHARLPGRLRVLSGWHHSSPVAVASGIYGAGAASMGTAREDLLAVRGRDLVSPLALCGRP